MNKHSRCNVAPTKKPPEGGFSSFQGCASHYPSGIAIPHYAAIFFAGSRSVNRAGRLRNDLAPKIWRLRSPIRAIETSARYDRGELSRETERVRRDPFSLFREICVSELLLDLASSFPHRPVGAAYPAASKTVRTAPKHHFRFASINGHHWTGPVGPLGANISHRGKQKALALNVHFCTLMRNDPTGAAFGMEPFSGG